MSSLDFSSFGLKNASASFRHKMCALFCIIILTIGRPFIGMLHTSLLSNFGFLVRFPWFRVSVLIAMLRGELMHVEIIHGRTVSRLHQRSQDIGIGSDDFRVIL